MLCCVDSSGLIPAELQRNSRGIWLFFPFEKCWLRVQPTMEPELLGSQKDGQAALAKLPLLSKRLHFAVEIEQDKLALSIRKRPTG